MKGIHGKREKRIIPVGGIESTWIRKWKIVFHFLSNVSMIFWRTLHFGPQQCGSEVSDHCHWGGGGGRFGSLRKKERNS